MFFVRVLIVISAICFSSQAFSKNWNVNGGGKTFDTSEVDAIEADLPQQFEFAQDFFVDNIQNQTCVVDGDVEKRFESTSKFLKVSPDDMYSKSTSLTIAFEYIAQPLHDLLANVYTAKSNGDLDLQKRLAGQVVAMAEAKVMASWMDWKRATKSGNSCWKSAGSKCPMHYPEIVQAAAGGLMMSAIYLREHFSESDKQTLNSYFDLMHEKFIEPLATQPAKSGFTANANGGFSNLAYAAWRKDAALFRRELAFRTWQMQRMITDEGFIEGNSWRGVRDYWYHTFGADQMYSYALLARSNGVDLFSHPLLKTKFRALAEATLMGNQSKEEFSSKGYKGSNYTKKKSKARPHVHQEALNLASILHHEFGIDLQLEPDFFKRKTNKVNIAVGFNSSCVYGFDENYQDPVPTTITPLIGDDYKGQVYQCNFYLQKSGHNDQGKPFGYFQADGTLNVQDGFLIIRDVNWNKGRRGMKRVPNERLLHETMSLGVRDGGILIGEFTTYSGRDAKHNTTYQTNGNYSFKRARGAEFDLEGEHHFIHPIPHIRPYPDIMDLVITGCR